MENRITAVCTGISRQIVTESPPYMYTLRCGVPYSMQPYGPLIFYLTPLPNNTMNGSTTTRSYIAFDYLCGTSSREKQQNKQTSESPISATLLAACIEELGQFVQNRGASRLIYKIWTLYLIHARHYLDMDDGVSFHFISFHFFFFFC